MRSNRPMRTTDNSSGRDAGDSGDADVYGNNADEPSSIRVYSRSSLPYLPFHPVHPLHPR
jgi:hypothetical protein